MMISNLKRIRSIRASLSSSGLACAALVGLAVLSCSSQGSLGGGSGEASAEGTRIPTATKDELSISASDDPDSPFSSEVFRRGLEAWRTPHTEGACASCHAPDAFDLAYFNYTDAVILRRAMGQEASIDDAQAIVDLVHWQRERHGIDAPVDPDVPFLQPGGSLAPGETMAQRDLNMYLLLRERGLALFQKEKIRTIEDAEAARMELLNLDLRTVRIGLPMNKWTSDVFRGERHRTLQKWIPESPRHPKEGKVKAWYDLQNAYIENPSPETLWGYVDKTAELTDDLGMFSRLAKSDANPDGSFDFAQKHTVYFNHYRSVQIAAHMMRVDDIKYPDFEPTDDDERLWTDRNFVDDMQDIAHDRITAFWDTGAPERGTRTEYLVEQVSEKFRNKITRVLDGGDLMKNHGFESTANQVVWMWQGMVYDPALQLSAAGNDSEYFYEQSDDLAGDFQKWAGNGVGQSGDNKDLSFHRRFMSDVMWVHASHGRDTRFDRKGLNVFPFYDSEGIGCRGGTLTEAGLGDSYPGGVPKGYEAEYVRYGANAVRMRVLTHLQYLRNYPGGPPVQCKDKVITMVEWLARHETQEDFAQISPAISELVVLLGEVPEDQEFDYGKHHFYDALPVEEAERLQREGNFLNPMRHESMPVLLPPGAREPFAPGPISATYDMKCAGCHGSEGKGGPTGGEDGGPYPPLKGYGDFEKFKKIVREGIVEETVPMPWFDQQDLSDDELKEMFDALQ